MIKPKGKVLYKALEHTVKKFYPKYTVHGEENLPAEPVILCGNHSQIYGPIASELYMPRKSYAWCVSSVMIAKEVPAYALTDFWSYKPQGLQWFYKLLGYAIAPLSVCVFTNAHTIPVYHDARLISTFKDTVQYLNNGADIVIFPEEREKYNSIINNLQQNFVDVARLYCKRAQKGICFVPMYIAPKRREIWIGKPISFNADVPIEQERERICTYIMQSITEMAAALPQHRVVPYDNIKKKDYPLNKPVIDYIKDKKQ